MIINSKYFIMSPLQQVLFDKLDGTLLAGGIVTFYKDSARNVKKQIYGLSGSPPDYQYLPIDNPLTLSDIGSYVDEAGNNIIPLLYPYDENGNIELYYIVVTSADERLQFTVQGWPQGLSAEINPDTTAEANYIPNGQFLIQNFISTDSIVPSGQAVVPVAYGNWTFERPNGTTSEDKIEFIRKATYTPQPTASPRYYAQITCVVPNRGDAYKNFCVKFADVNRLTSNNDQWTLMFYGASISAAFDIEIQLKKFFGAGGSPTKNTKIDTITLTPDGNTFFINFIVGNNNGKSIGNNDDDYIQLVLSLPSSYAFSAQFTDFALFNDTVTNVDFPIETEYQTTYRTLGGSIDISKSATGWDLYVPMIKTATGISFDYSQIGQVIGSLASNVPAGYLPMDGAMYATNDHSSEGIPYARLQSVLWNDTLQVPIGGTGIDYMTGVYAGTEFSTTNQLIITNNNLGACTNASDGSNPTGFTFGNVCNGLNASLNVKSYLNQVTVGNYNQFYIRSTGTGVVSIAAGTSGFNVDIANGHDGSDGDTGFMYVTTSNSGIGSLGGKYFSFTDYTGASRYVWFTVNGSGSDPSPGGTGRRVNLLSSYDVGHGANVAMKIQQALNGWQSTYVLTVAASTIPTGSYFNIYTPTQQYYIWYTVDGVGTDPLVSNAIGIQVDILSTDTASQVASKTQTAINMLNFAVPDFRGLFLRGIGGSLNDWDPAAVIQRFSQIPWYTGDIVGTYQIDQILQHDHKYYTPNGFELANGGTQIDISNWPLGEAFTVNNGFYQNRPVSAAVNWLIKY